MAQGARPRRPGHRTAGRPVSIAELRHPAGHMREGAFARWNQARERCPVRAEGQASLLKELVAWGASSGVAGMRPWGPQLTVPGWAPMALFAPDGKTAS